MRLTEVMFDQLDANAAAGCTNGRSSRPGALQPRLSAGGYCNMPDYGPLPGAQRAVHAYQKANDIEEEVVDIEGTWVFLRETSPDHATTSPAIPAAAAEWDSLRELS